MQTNDEIHVTSHQGVSAKKSGEYDRGARPSRVCALSPPHSLHSFAMTWGASVFFTCEVGIAVAILLHLSLI